jgi:hypothetical protein
LVSDSLSKKPSGSDGRTRIWFLYETQGKSKMIERPIQVIDQNGHLLPEVYEVIDFIAAHDMILATRHLSISEVRWVVKTAKEMKHF